MELKNDVFNLYKKAVPPVRTEKMCVDDGILKFRYITRPAGDWGLFGQMTHLFIYFLLFPSIFINRKPLNSFSFVVTLDKSRSTAVITAIHGRLKTRPLPIHDLYGLYTFLAYNW